MSIESAIITHLHNRSKHTVSAGTIVKPLSQRLTSLRSQAMLWLSTSCVHRDQLDYTCTYIILFAQGLNKRTMVEQKFIYITHFDSMGFVNTPFFCYIKRCRNIQRSIIKLGAGEMKWSYLPGPWIRVATAPRRGGLRGTSRTSPPTTQTQPHQQFDKHSF